MNISCSVLQSNILETWHACGKYSCQEQILRSYQNIFSKDMLFLTPLPYKPIHYIRFFHWPIKFFLHIMYITLSNQFLSIYVEELVGLWTLRGNEEQTEYWKLGNYHVVYRCAENYKIQDPKISYIIEIRYWIHFNLILLYSDFSTKY